MRVNFLVGFESVYNLFGLPINARHFSDGSSHFKRIILFRCEIKLNFKTRSVEF